MAPSKRVRPPVGPLTELDAREALAKSLLSLCSVHGPTKVALGIGTNEKTVRNARDEKSTLRIDRAANLVLLDPSALNPLFGKLGMKLVQIDAGEHSDRASLSCLTKLLLQMSLALEDDGEIDDSELAAMRDALEQAGQSVDRLRHRLSVRAA